MMDDPQESHTDGDQIQVGDVQKSVLAIGAGAQAIVNHITQAMPTQAEEAEQQDARERRLLAEGLQHIVNGLTRQAENALAETGQGSPYKALLDYTISDAALFYGRDTAIADLQSRLRDPLTILHSESGAGKTSLLKAGLMPRLLAAGDLPIYLRFFRTRPDLALRQTLIGAGQQSPELAARPLRDFLRVAAGLLGSGRLVILLDQFEEIFTQHDQPERAAFAAELASCLDDPALPVRWVMALRGEWLSQIATFDPPVNRPYSNSLLLRALNADQARAVIEEPARLYGVSVEPALTDVLLADLAVDGAIAPPHLQLVCDALYRSSAGEDFDMRLDEYHALGGAQGILQNHLQQVLEREVGPDYREAARRLLDALIDSQGRRAQRDQDQLVGELERLGIAPLAAGEALRLLLNNRLLRVIEEQDEDHPEQVYELAHDYLLERIELDPETQARKAAQELLERESINYQIYGSLLGPDRLAIIEAQEDSLYIEREAGDLIAASRAERERVHAEQERQRQRQVRILSGAAIMSLILAAVAVFFGWQSRQAAARAEAALQVSASQRLAAQARDLLDEQHQVAMLLGIEAAQITPGGTVEAWSTLWDGLRMELPNAKYLTDHTVEVNSVAFSPDGQILASASQDGIIFLWDVVSGQRLGEGLVGHSYGGRSYGVSNLAFSPDGQILATAGGDDTVILWDVASGEPIGTPLAGHTNDVTSVVFSPDGLTLASASADNTVRLWNAVTGQPLGTPLIGHTGRVADVAFSPDGQTLASASWDDTVILWNAATGEPLDIRLTGHEADVTSVAFSPNGQTLASGSYNGTIILWDVATGEMLGAPLARHTAGVMSVAFSPDGETLASASRDRTIILWDVASGEPSFPPLAGHTDTVVSVAFSPDGQSIASASWDKTVILWRMSADRKPDTLFTGHSDSVTDVAFSPDGETFASASRDRTIILWDVATGEQLGEPLTGHTDTVTSVAFRPDGQTIASAGLDDRIILWDVMTGQPSSAQPTESTGNVMSLAFSPDGQTLAWGSAEQIILWDVAAGGPSKPPLSGHVNRVNNVVFNPDGQTLVSASTDRIIILWDVATGQPLGSAAAGHSMGRSSLAFSPDGQILASGGGASVRLWNASMSQPLGSLLAGNANDVSSVAFSPDGQTLALGSADGTIRLWDVATGQQLGEPLTGHTDEVNSVAFSPDGRILASGSADGTVRLWQVWRENWFALACQRAGRNMTREEWQRYLPDEPYRATCSEFPLP